MEKFPQPLHSTSEEVPSGGGYFGRGFDLSLSVFIISLKRIDISGQPDLGLERFPVSIRQAGGI